MGQEMVLCIVALVVFSVMSVGSTKYKDLARQALKCVMRNITLRPCDVGLEQSIKGKITAKLLVVPSLARFFYRNFQVIAWAFTITFFASLVYTAYSIYNFAVYGSCEPGGTCYLTPIIGWCILLVEKALVYIVVIIVIAIAAYLIVKRLRRRS